MARSFSRKKLRANKNALNSKKRNKESSKLRRKKNVLSLRKNKILLRKKSRVKKGGASLDDGTSIPNVVRFFGPIHPSLDNKEIKLPNQGWFHDHSLVQSPLLEIKGQHSGDFQIDLVKTSPHTTYRVTYSNSSDSSGSSGGSVSDRTISGPEFRYSEARKLYDLVTAEMRDKLPAFPKKFMQNSFGMKLSSAALEERRRGLDEWLNALRQLRSELNGEAKALFATLVLVQYIAPIRFGTLNSKIFDKPFEYYSEENKTYMEKAYTFYERVNTPEKFKTEILSNFSMTEFDSAFGAAKDNDSFFTSEDPQYYHTDWTQLNPEYTIGETKYFLRINPFLETFLNKDNITDFERVAKGGLKACLEKISKYHTTENENKFILAEDEEWPERNPLSKENEYLSGYIEGENYKEGDNSTLEFRNSGLFDKNQFTDEEKKKYTTDYRSGLLLDREGKEKNTNLKERIDSLMLLDALHCMIYFSSQDYYEKQHAEILRRLQHPYTLRDFLGKLNNVGEKYILACQEFPKEWKEEEPPDGWKKTLSNNFKKDELSLLTYGFDSPEKGEVKTLIGNILENTFPYETGLLNSQNYEEIVKKMMYCHFNELNLVVVNMHFPSKWEKKSKYNLNSINLPKVLSFLQEKMVEKKPEFIDCEFVFMGDTNMKNQKVNATQKGFFDAAVPISVYPTGLKLTTRKKRTILQSQISKVNDDVEACKDIIARLKPAPKQALIR